MIRNPSLLAVPTLIFIFGIAILHWMFPIFSGIFGYDYDPAYQYLMNGLGLMYGYSPGLVEHPGTPVQTFVGVITALAWAVRATAGVTSLSFARDVVALPETYLSIVAHLFLLMNCTAIFYLGWRITRASVSVNTGIAAQAGYLLLCYLFPRVAYVSPEPMLIFAAVMLMAMLSDAIFADKRPDNIDIVGVSFFIALGVASKITFLPLVLVVLLFLDLRAILIAAALISLFTLGLLAPIYRKLRYTYDWYVNIATHDGNYGTGKEAFMAWGEIPDRLLQFVVAIPLYFAGLGAAALTVRNSLRGTIFFAIGLGQLFLGLKHFGMHYLLPFLSICPVVIVWAATRLGLRERWLNAATLAAIASGAIYLIGTTRDFAIARAERDAKVAVLNAAIAKFPNAVVVPTYHSYVERYAMHFGGSSVDGRFSNALGLATDDNLMFWYGNRLLGIPGRGGKELPFLQQFLDVGRPVLIVQAGGAKITPAEATTKTILDLGDGQTLDQIIDIHGAKS